jgi:ABC-type multidrug transport system fused ATPase/permease subunit
MDIYTRKSYWKWYLGVFGLVIVLISLWYTQYLATKLTLREEEQAKLYAEAQRTLNKAEADTALFFNMDLTLPARVIELNSTIPVVLVSAGGHIEDAMNVDGAMGPKVDTFLVRKALQKMQKNGLDSVDASVPPDVTKTVYFSRSNLLDSIYWFPLIQFSLILAFVLFAYFAFSAARRAEQNWVWLGMAKETAHQLGTPMTAILGWLETLKTINEDRPDNLEMLGEMRKDLDRLELVADRFSKIGAAPELSTHNIYTEIDECRAYMQRRAPRKVSFDFPDPAAHPPLQVNINAHLFDWVVENLLRNAIDAMEQGEGRISARIFEKSKFVCIEISDTGKGIAPGKLKTVFKPGYSTKKRGWGLGLSLSKRIVEEYHKGKIYVKKSELGKGTTFMSCCERFLCSEKVGKSGEIP